jgi:nucleoside-diphosphate-sugar epimerase
MKILITGAAGTIGSVLLKCLSENHNVVGIDKIPSDNIVTLDIVNEHERLRELTENVDVVIHLAWDMKESGTALGVFAEEFGRSDTGGLHHFIRHSTDRSLRMMGASRDFVAARVCDEIF